MPLLLLALALGTAAAQAQRGPTFHRDVAPILFEHCAGCHRSGGSAPFSLLTYEEARRQAREIAEATASRRMPPWLPREGYARFKNSRHLTEREIGVLQHWSEAPREGDPSRSPPPPAHTEGWHLGKPDLVVAMPEPYLLPAGDADVYRNFVLPVSLKAPRFVRAVEFRPGARGVVHHARLLVDRTGEARALDARDPEPGYDGMMMDKAELPDGVFLGWAPGKVPLEGDEALIWRLSPGTDLVVQAHMMPWEASREVELSVGLFFTEDAPERRAAVLMLGSKTIDIPAGAAAHPVEDSYVLPADVEVIGIYPHAHYLCREMRVRASLPDGREQWLLWIPEWDFFWQDEYLYETPIPLPKGTKISMRFVYDNSVQNPQNPFDPPRRVRFGPSSRDEMGEVLLMMVPREVDALASLREDFGRHELLQSIAGYEKMLADDPEDAVLQNALGFAHSQLGHGGEAVAAYERAIRLEPTLAEAHYNLGSALAARRELEEAADAFRDALEANPSYAEAHNNLGVVLQTEGRLDDAIDHYRKAVKLRPDYAFALHNLGNAFLAKGKLEDAVEQLGAAIRVDPDYAEAHYSLAGALGKLGRIEEEIAHYRRAIAARPRFTEALHNLGAVLLLTGRADEAVAPLREATRIRPDYGLAFANLARALAESAEPEALGESVHLFRKAIALRPDDPTVHRDLAAAATRAGRIDSALTHYRIALSLAPDDPSTLAGLAWALAVHPREDVRAPETARRLAERARRLTGGRDPEALDALAAAHAGAGRFDDAVELAEKARDAAGAAGRSELAAAISSRLDLYREHIPYRIRESPAEK